MLQYYPSVFFHPSFHSLHLARALTHSLSRCKLLLLGIHITNTRNPFFLSIPSVVRHSQKTLHPPNASHRNHSPIVSSTQAPLTNSHPTPLATDQPALRLLFEISHPVRNCCCVLVQDSTNATNALPFWSTDTCSSTSGGSPNSPNL